LAVTPIEIKLLYRVVKDSPHMAQAPPLLGQGVAVCLKDLRNRSNANAGGGCAIFSDRLACEETLTLARKAIIALEACTAPTAQNNTADR
jgi:hypothetical protein